MVLFYKVTVEQRLEGSEETHHVNIPRVFQTWKTALHKLPGASEAVCLVCSRSSKETFPETKRKIGRMGGDKSELTGEPEYERTF